MARHHAPDTCTADDCNHVTHFRTHDRNPRRGSEPHEDAPLEEAVCSIHGIVYSA